LQPWVLVKLCHSTSANGVANYNDDQCDNLYDVFQHYGFNLMEFPASPGQAHGSRKRKKRGGALVTGAAGCMSEPLPLRWRPLAATPQPAGRLNQVQLGFHGWIWLARYGHWWASS
jgi:hypothetical protein